VVDLIGCVTTAVAPIIVALQDGQPELPPFAIVMS
jgi:hypothetical protein